MAGMSVSCSAPPPRPPAGARAGLVPHICIRSGSLQRRVVAFAEAVKRADLECSIAAAGVVPLGPALAQRLRQQAQALKAELAASGAGREQELDAELAASGALDAEVAARAAGLGAAAAAARRVAAQAAGGCQQAAAAPAAAAPAGAAGPGPVDGQPADPPPTAAAAAAPGEGDTDMPDAPASLAIMPPPHAVPGLPECWWSGARKRGGPAAAAPPAAGGAGGGGGTSRIQAEAVAWMAGQDRPPKVRLGGGCGCVLHCIPRGG